LALSGALSVALTASFDKETLDAGRDEVSLAAAAEAADPFGEAGGWRVLELPDAGAMEIPGSWRVENTGGERSQVRHGEVVQNIRRSLTAHPYGNREGGPDFLFEVVVYWWTRSDGRPLSPPWEVVGKLQEQQLDSLRRSLGDAGIASMERTETYGGRAMDALTVETLSVSTYAVRFKNLAFKEGEKLYAVMAGYPAHEESAWESLLDRLMGCWRFPGE
jgi:hypothetical protein